jgi:hypothetical protein
MRNLRDELPNAPDRFEALPQNFMEARGVIRTAIEIVESSSIPGDTLIAVLMSETLPRIIQSQGPAVAGALLARLGQQIAAGAAPGTARQEFDRRA